MRVIRRLDFPRNYVVFSHLTFISSYHHLVTISSRIDSHEEIVTR